MPPAKKSTESSFKKTHKSGYWEFDAKLTSFIFENSIPINAAEKSSFAAMIKEAWTFCQQNPLLSKKACLYLCSLLPHFIFLVQAKLIHAGTSAPRLATSLCRTPASYTEICQCLFKQEVGIAFAAWKSSRRLHGTGWLKRFRLALRVFCGCSSQTLCCHAYIPYHRHSISVVMH